MRRPSSSPRSAPSRILVAPDGPLATLRSWLPRSFPDCSWRLSEPALARFRSRAPSLFFSRLSSEPRAKSTPAELQALFDADRGDAGHRLVGDELLAAVDAVQLRAVLDVLGDLLDAVGGHQQRVLLRGGGDDAVLEPRHREAATVDGDSDDALVLACRLQRRHAAVGGRLVDRIDDIDVVGLLQDVLHRLAAALGRAAGHVGADDLRAGALGIVLGILDRDPEAIEEAVVTVIVDRRLVGREIEGGDLGGRRLVAEFGLRPRADQLARRVVVGA